MYYVHEQITKIFEYLLDLHYKYHSIDTFISSTRKSRILYRINQEKLEKYHSQNNSKYDHEDLIANQNKKSQVEETNVIPIIHRKTTSTQTIFNKEIDSSVDETHSSGNTLSIISKGTSELNISATLSSVSSSLSSINKTITTKTSNSSITEFDSEVSMKTDCNQIQKYKFNDHSSKQPQSTNCRVYIRSIVRHMLSEDTSSDEE